MSLETYADLKAACAAWLNRTDLTAVIPDFITLAEAYLSRELKTRRQVVTATLTTTAGNALIAVPADFNVARQVVLQVTPKVLLEPLAMQALTEHAAYETSGRPRVYAIAGGNLSVSPVPDTAYDMELTYFSALPSLSGDAPSNWLLTSHPDAYLYATLMQSAPYLGDDPRVAVWGTLLERVLEAINIDSDASEWQAGALASRVTTATP